MYKYFSVLMIFLLVHFGLVVEAGANEVVSDPHEQDRKELRAILADMEKAISTQDIDGMLKHAAPNVIVTFYDATAVKNKAEVTAYYKRMMEGANKIVNKMTTKGTVGAPANFYGNTAVAFGDTQDHFELVGGLTFDVSGKWSATLVKKNNAWKIVSLHFSVNMFDNPLLRNAQRMTVWVGAGGVLVGMLIVLMIRRFRKK